MSSASAEDAAATVPIEAPAATVMIAPPSDMFCVERVIRDVASALARNWGVFGNRIFSLARSSGLRIGAVVLGEYKHIGEGRYAQTEAAIQALLAEAPAIAPYNLRMNDGAWKVTVAKDLEDLIPTFMKNRKKELDALRVALAAADFEQLRQLGHRMKGVGVSYGFDQVSALGKSIEEGARRGDRALLETSIDQYGDYLAGVQVSYE